MAKIKLATRLRASGASLEGSGSTGVPAPNLAPQWTSSAIQLSAEPAGSVLFQIQVGPLTTPGNHVVDPEGLPLTFNCPDGSVEALNLVLSPAGQLSGQISDTQQVGIYYLTFRASDGVRTSDKTVVFSVGVVTDVDADYDARSFGPGVFWATNFKKWTRGIDGYVSQPVKDFPAGQPDRITTPINSPTEIPSTETGTMPANKFSGDIGDGWGIMKLVEYPGLSGLMLQLRPRSLYKTGGGNSDYNTLPWAWVPMNWADTEEGTGQPNERKGQPNSTGAGKVFPFVETTIENDPATGLPYKSSNNTANRPMIRHFYLQYRIWMPERWLYFRQHTWSNDYVNSVGKFVRSTKQVFVNGGNGPGQFAIGNAEQIGIIKAIYQDKGGSFGGAANPISTGTGTFAFSHSAINVASAPDPVYGAGIEGYFKKYGPYDNSMVYGNGMRVNGEPISPDSNWYPIDHPKMAGLEYIQGNTLANPNRGYPYGGFPLDGRKPFPDMGWSDEATAGIIRPNRLHTIEVLYSVQVNASINNDKTIKVADVRNAGLGNLGPCFIACWAAPDGEPPVCLWHTGSNPNSDHLGYPALVPTLSLHRGSGNLTTTGSDDYLSFQSQDNSTAEDASNTGFMVVGALDGFPEPTTTEFYALRANPGKNVPLRGPYAASASNKAVDPGPKENWGSGLVFGWAYSDLYDVPGDDVSPYEKNGRWQFRIERTDLASPNPITVPNAYQNMATSVTDYVHKFTLVSPMPFPPRARSLSYQGDTLNVLFGYDQRRPLGNEVGYGEIIVSMKQIPFPGFLTTPLPMPWKD